MTGVIRAAAAQPITVPPTRHAVEVERMRVAALNLPPGCNRAAFLGPLHPATPEYLAGVEADRLATEARFARAAAARKAAGR